MCVLVVDDEVLIRDSVSDFLRSLGYMVFEAEDGNRALQIVAETAATIKAVVTDMHMPGLTGLEMWHRMQDVVSPRCGVLFMSGRADLLPPGTVLPGELLVKPFSFGLLKEKLSAIVAPAS